MFTASLLLATTIQLFGSCTPHDAGANVWSDKRVEGVHVVGTIPVKSPGSGAIKEVRVSPEFMVVKSTKPGPIRLLVVKNLTRVGQVEQAHPTSTDQIGVRRRFSDGGRVLSLSSYGTYAAPKSAALVEAVVIVPPGMKVTQPKELYSVADSPTTVVQVAKPWKAVELAEDSIGLSDIYTPELAERAAFVEESLRKELNKPVYNYDGTLKPGAQYGIIDHDHISTRDVNNALLDAVIADGSVSLFPCWKRFNEQHPNAKGVLRIRFSIRGSDGGVDLVSVPTAKITEENSKSPKTFEKNKKAFAKCIESQIRTWQFEPPSTGEDVLVRREFDVEEPPGDE